MGRLVLFIAVLFAACTHHTKRHLRSYIDVQKKGGRIEDNFSPTDTAIVYYRMCSGCLEGTVQYMYLLKKSGDATISSLTTNFGKFKKQKVDIPWAYLIATFQNAVAENLYPEWTEIVENGKVVKVYTNADHGPSYKMVLHTEKGNAAFAIGPETFNARMRVVQNGLIDTIYSIVSKRSWKRTSYRLERRNYH